MNTERKERFDALKAEILKRAKEKQACKGEYSRALKSNTYQELLQVVKDNFFWATNNKVINEEIITEYKKQFNDNDIWCDESASTGFLLAYGSATVMAYGSATVEAYGSAMVRATDSATVRACDSSYCISYSTIECKLSKNAIHRVVSTNTIYTAADSELTFK